MLPMASASTENVHADERQSASSGSVTDAGDSVEYWATWVYAPKDESVRANRASYVGSNVGGLVIKCTQGHAPDVRNAMAVLGSISAEDIPEGNLGVCAALSSQMYTQDAIQKVEELVPKDRSWDRAALLALKKGVAGLDKRMQGKRVGLANKQMGVNFLDTLLEGSAKAQREKVQILLDAGMHLETSLLQVEPPEFNRNLTVVKLISKISDHNGCRMTRMIGHCRLLRNLKPLVVTEGDVAKLMHMGSGPKKGFAALDVTTPADAHVMLAVMRRAMPDSKCNRLMNILDLPVSVCEWMGLQEKTGSAQALLAKLPTARDKLIELRVRLGSGLWHPRYQDGHDLSSASNLGGSWLAAAPVLPAEQSAWGAYINNTFVHGPQILCKICKNAMPLERYAKASGGRPCTTCDLPTCRAVGQRTLHDMFPIKPTVKRGQATTSDMEGKRSKRRRQAT